LPATGFEPTLSTMQRWFIIALSLAPAFLCIGAGKKAQPIVVSFHLEAPTEEAPKFAIPVKLGSQLRQYFFRRTPEFTEKDVAYYYPFMSKNGTTFGVGFKLTPGATEELKGLALNNQGRLLGIRIAPTHYSAVIIDRPDTPGVITVWEGLTQDDLKTLDKVIPHAEKVVRPAGAPPAQ